MAADGRLDSSSTRSIRFLQSHMEEPVLGDVPAVGAPPAISLLTNRDCPCPTAPQAPTGLHVESYCQPTVCYQAQRTSNNFVTAWNSWLFHSLLPLPADGACGPCKELPSSQEDRLPPATGKSHHCRALPFVRCSEKEPSPMVCPLKDDGYVGRGGECEYRFCM